MNRRGSREPAVARRAAGVVLARLARLVRARGEHLPPRVAPRNGDMNGAAREFRESLRLLRSRRFGTFWSASLLSNVGTWAQQVAEPWLLLSLGASSFLIGLDSFAMNAPIWFLTLMGGVLADRSDRRRVITLFQSIQMLCPLVIVIALWSGSVTPPLIIALSLVVGITDALSMPSFQSIVPSIVERDQIGRGVALNSTQFNLSRILGPAIAGVLMASAGVVACFALSAASYIPFIGVALWILPRRNPGRASAESLPRRNPLAHLREITSTPKLRGALFIVFTTSVLCGPLVTFTPVLVSAGFHGDSSRFSAAISAFGLGGLLGAIGLLAVPSRQDRRRWSSLAAVVYASTLIAAATLPSYSALPVIMVIGGAAMTIGNTSANTLLQSTADPRLLGQTASLYMLAMRGGLSIGGLLTGISVDWLGVRRALFINGMLTLIVLTAIAGSWARPPSRGDD